jgi:group I intron endonuclease
MIGIYKVTSPTGRVYIGQSLDIQRRWRGYKDRLCKTQVKLNRSFRKYGVDAHTFEVILECPIDKLNYYERHYQELYCTVSRKGLNCRLTQTDTRSGVLSEETRKKIGRANKGKLSGKKRPEGCVERRLKTREANGANERVSKLYTGRKLPKEIIEKISRTTKGRKKSKEHIKKAAEGKYKPLLYIESGVVYSSRKEATKVFNKSLDYAIKRGLFVYL